MEELLDPKEYPYIVEFCNRAPGSKVYKQQVSNQAQVVDAVRRYNVGSWQVVGIHKIQQITVEDFMKEAKQYNYCNTCKEFINDSEKAMSCDEQDHDLTWKDDPDEASQPGPSA